MFKLITKTVKRLQQKWPRSFSTRLAQATLFACLLVVPQLAYAGDSDSAYEGCCVHCIYDKAVEFHEAWYEASLSLPDSKMKGVFKKLLSRFKRRAKKCYAFSRIEFDTKKEALKVLIRTKKCGRHDVMVTRKMSCILLKTPKHVKGYYCLGSELINHVERYPLRRHFHCDGKPLNPGRLTHPASKEGVACGASAAEKSTVLSSSFTDDDFIFVCPTADKNQDLMYVQHDSLKQLPLYEGRVVVFGAIPGHQLESFTTGDERRCSFGTAVKIRYSRLSKIFYHHKKLPFLLQVRDTNEPLVPSSWSYQNNVFFNWYAREGIRIGPAP